MASLGHNELICEGRPQGDSPHKRHVCGALIFFAVHLNTLLNKHSSCKWFETPFCSCDVTVMPECEITCGLSCVAFTMMILNNGRVRVCRRVVMKRELAVFGVISAWLLMAWYSYSSYGNVTQDGSVYGKSSDVLFSRCCVGEFFFQSVWISAWPAHAPATCKHFGRCLDPSPHVANCFYLRCYYSSMT